jgi:hypothetical protein
MWSYLLVHGSNDNKATPNDFRYKLLWKLDVFLIHGHIALVNYLLQAMQV